MKKIVMAILTLLLISLFSCSTMNESSTGISDTTNLSEDNMANTVTTANLEISNVAESDSDNSSAEGGSINTLDEHYQFIYENICYPPDTFMALRFEDVCNAINKVDKLYKTYTTLSDENLKRDPLIVFLIKELDLSKEDVLKYYEVAYEEGAFNVRVTAEDVDALFGDDETMKTHCMAPMAIYKDGCVLTPIAVDAMSDEQLKQYNITGDDIQLLLKKVEKYAGENNDIYLSNYYDEFIAKLSEKAGLTTP